MECVQWVKGPKKVIRYWCPERGCRTSGRISTIPASAADGIFEVVKQGHAEDPGGEASPSPG